MVTYLFPGQGSQVKGMGAPLFIHFKDLITKADAILGYSVEELCMEDPHDLLGQTQYTQPALYVVNALSYFYRQATMAQQPCFLIGHSLGEYNALLAAEVFDFETGLRLVQKRGELMSQAINGAMAAVIGLSKEKITEVLKENQLDQISLANDNSYLQLVISGEKTQMEKAIPVLEIAGAKMLVVLKTSGAFHSPLMLEAQQQFAVFITSFSFSAPKIPVIANVNAKPYAANDIQVNLIQQMTHAVRFTESIEYAMARGEEEFVEVGPGNVLTKLVKRIKNKQ